MNRSFRLTQLSFLHRTWENENTAFIYILCWKNEIVLFFAKHKRGHPGGSEGEVNKPKRQNMHFQSFTYNFFYLEIRFFFLMILLCTLWSSSKCKSVRSRE